MTNRSVLFACDLDSQVFGAMPIAKTFAARGWRVTFAIESSQALSQSLLDTLSSRFELIERRIGALAADEEAFRHEAIGVYVTGSRLALFRHTLELSTAIRGRPRPALFCGFNGLVFEKFEEGLAWRLGYDVICLNSPRDRDAFVDFVQGSHYARQPSVIVGLRRKTDAPPRPMKLPAPKIDAHRGEAAASAVDEKASRATVPNDTGETPSAVEPVSAQPEIGSDEPDPSPPRPVADEARPPESSDPGRSSDLSTEVQTPAKLFVFAEQVVVPRSLGERQALVGTLAKLAAGSPNWTVAIKARVRPSEKTFHSQSNHIQALVKAVKGKPRNLVVTYEPIEQLLERADLFATISSTALFDALDHGVPSLVATDFGLRNADGAHVFFSSGLLTRLSDLSSLDAAELRGPDQRWLGRMGYGGAYSPAALVDWVDSFDAPRIVMPKAFVSFEGAAQIAAGAPARARPLIEAWTKAKSILSDDNAEGGRLGPAALIRLGAAISTALEKTPSSSPAPAPARVKAAKPSPPDARAPRQAFIDRSPQPSDDAVARYARRIGMYWVYKKFRNRIGIPLE